jgi:hypothetical protein
LVDRYRHLDLIGDYYNKETTVFVKTNELLPTHEKFVPRLIFNCHPSYLDRLGPYVEAITHHLVENVWSKIPRVHCTIDGVDVYAYFTCGATSKDLNSFVNSAVDGPSGIYLLIMGDDTWGYDSSKADPEFFECDYSKFDATQTKPLRAMFLNWLRRSGLHTVANDWESLYAQKLSYRHRKTRTNSQFPRVEQFLTGEPGTCLRNSFTNIAVSAFAAVRGPHMYTKAGLIAKFQKPGHRFVTFLRGVFLIDENGKYSWTKLPSFLLKFGKSMTDPLSIYSKNWSKDKRYRQFVWSQWLGMGAPRNNWFYKAIHEYLTDVCAGSENVEVKEEYKVYQDVGDWISDEEFDQFIFTRYELEHHHLQTFIDLLRGNKQLPLRYSSEVLSVFEKRDY